jgi:hypothetical protein
MHDSFVEAVGALPHKGLSILSQQFLSFNRDKFLGGREPPVDSRLGQGFKWKSPYSLANEKPQASNLRLCFWWFVKRKKVFL